MNPPVESPAAELLVLNASEARLLGCLIEKEITTPDVYPLTVKAAQAAANQKTARDPVVSLDPGEVDYTLRQLEQKGLAKQTFSSRADRYEHRTAAFFSLPQQQVVLLGLLLLRGPQTLYELLSRSERLHKFADIEDVRHHLDRMIHRQPALIVQIPRAPGQREDRFMHLLCGPVDIQALNARTAVHSESSGAVANTALEQRVQALEDTVARMQAQLERLPGASPPEAP